MESEVSWLGKKIKNKSHVTLNVDAPMRFLHKKTLIKEKLEEMQKIIFGCK